MIMMSVSAMGVVTVLWVLYGYSVAFGDLYAGIIGNPGQFFGLKGPDPERTARPTRHRVTGTIPPPYSWASS